MSNNTLPESVKDRIEKEANKLFKKGLTSFDIQISPLEAEVLRSLGLVDALRTILEGKGLSGKRFLYRYEAKEIAKKALENYNQNDKDKKQI